MFTNLIRIIENVKRRTKGLPKERATGRRVLERVERLEPPEARRTANDSRRTTQTERRGRGRLAVPLPTLRELRLTQGSYPAGLATAVRVLLR
jgi:hypothetical protein